jgi:hypothetical protein
MSGMASIEEVLDGGDTSTSLPQTNGLSTVVDWMVKTSSVTGFVTDQKTGKGINGATVVVNDHIVTKWKPGLSNAYVNVTTADLTATTAARTEGGDGYYTITGLPALVLDKTNFGAYATGYEYTHPSNDESKLDLQYGATAKVDFALSAVDNKLGVVVANVTTTSGGIANDLMILLDASGEVPHGSIANVDVKDANQFVFNLIFDQAVDTTRFYDDSIQLCDKNGIVIAPNLAPAWINSFSVTLTGKLDYYDDLIGNEYYLKTKRVIRGAGNETIASDVKLAQFQVYNSSYTVGNPTPAIYADNNPNHLYIIGYNDKAGAFSATHYYDATEGNDLYTTAQYYTGIWEDDMIKKSVYTLASHPLADSIDIYWGDEEPYYKLENYHVWLRERFVSGSGVDEVFNNWQKATVFSPIRSNNMVIFQNVTVPFTFDRNMGILRSGNQLDVAVTVTNTLGVESMIDPSKVLTFRDNQSPEIKAITSPVYDEAIINFNEYMSRKDAISVTTENSALFSISSPTWNDDTTALRLHITGNATALLYLTGTGVDIVDVDGSEMGKITFNGEGKADQYFIGQVVKLTYNDGTQTTHQVTEIYTHGSTPDIRITTAGLEKFSSGTALLTVDNEATSIRSGAQSAFSGSTDDVYIPCPSNQVAVGDKLILRDLSHQSGTYASEVEVTVADRHVEGGVQIATIGSMDTSGYDMVIFKGDVLKVEAKDEAGNSMHNDADEVTFGYNGSGTSNIK